MKNFDWQPKHIDQLRTLHSTGMSYSDIAKVIGPGVLTRNAVIGKAKRLGGLQRREISEAMRASYDRRKRGLPPLPRPPRPYRSRAKPEWERVVRPRAVKPAPVVPAEAPVSLAIRFADRKPSQCSFIAGEPTAAATCCGHSVHTGSSFCAWHHHLVWHKPESRAR